MKNNNDIKYLLYDIANSSDAQTIYSKYRNNRQLLKDYLFIVCAQGENCVDLYKEFYNTKGIEDILFTPLSRRVTIINNRIFMRYFCFGDSRPRLYINVSFDTQTISYIEDYSNKNVNHKNFDVVKYLLESNRVGIDYIPYTLENLLFNSCRAESVKRTIYAFEMLCAENRQDKNKCLKRANKILKLYEDKKSPVLLSAQAIYKLVYIALLKMCQIQFENTNKSLDKKMNLLAQFMAEELCRMLLPELILAKKFFVESNTCKFFGKIQKGRKDIIKSLKNMAWDLIHLRFIGITSPFYKKKADALIPFFFTYDKGLKDVRYCYDLKALVINTRTNIPISFYKHENKVFKYVNDYYTSDQVLQRAKADPDLDKIIDKLESDLTKLC